MKYEILAWDYDNDKRITFIENLAPIVLFTYNRLDHTIQTVRALQDNIYAKDSNLYIYSDAPKNEDARPKVAEVRQYLRSVDGFKNITIIEREENWGLAGNIIDGVTKIVNEYGKIIVLEDDIVTSKYFLKYMNDALELYKDEEKVMQISGYLYPIKKRSNKETFFIKLPLPWGWATWKKSWGFFERDLSTLEGKFTKDSIKKFNFDNQHDFWDQVVSNIEGKIFTWYIFWYISVFLNEGLVLYPKNSLVRNIGFDSSGEHCSSTGIYDICINHQEIKISFNDLQEDREMREAFKNYFKSIRPSFLCIIYGKYKIYKIKKLIMKIFKLGK